MTDGEKLKAVEAMLWRRYTFALGQSTTYSGAAQIRAVFVADVLNAAAMECREIIAEPEGEPR